MRTIAILFCLAFISAGCGLDNGPVQYGTSRGSFRAVADGMVVQGSNYNSYYPRVTATYDSLRQYLTITLSSDSSNAKITLAATNVRFSGNYFLSQISTDGGNPISGAAATCDAFYWDGSRQFSTDVFRTGTLDLTTFDLPFRRLSGTFHFDAYQVYGIEPFYTISVTDGVFTEVPIL